MQFGIFTPSNLYDVSSQKLNQTKSYGIRAITKNRNSMHVLEMVNCNIYFSFKLQLCMMTACEGE